MPGNVISTPSQAGGGIFPVHEKTPPPGAGSGVISSKTDGLTKSTPYVSDKRDPIDRCSNAKTTFGGTKMPIVCRQMALQFLIDLYADEAGKIDHTKFQEAMLAEHVPIEREQNYWQIFALSPKKTIIDNDKLGQHLVALFAEMDASGASLKGVLLNSTNHAMALRLRIKTDEKGIKTYVVSMYDPNKSSTWVRCAEKSSDSLEHLPVLSKLTTKDLLGEKFDKPYFGGSNTAVLIPVEKDFLDRVVAGALDPRLDIGTQAAETDLHVDSFNSTHLYHLMANNLSNTLGECELVFEHIHATNPARFLQLVLGKADPDNGVTALMAAMGLGYTEAIKHYGSIFKMVDVTSRSEVLIEASGNGLSLCMAKDDVETLNTCKPLLESIPVEERAEVLIQITGNGLALAMQANKCAAVQAYRSLLELVPLSQRAKVLSAVSQRGVALALYGGYPSVIKAYQQNLLELVPLEQRGQTFSEPGRKEIQRVLPGLKKNPGLVKAYQDLQKFVAGRE